MSETAEEEGQPEHNPKKNKKQARVKPQQSKRKEAKIRKGEAGDSAESLNDEADEEPSIIEEDLALEVSEADQLQAESLVITPQEQAVLQELEVISCELVKATSIEDIKMLRNRLAMIRCMLQRIRYAFEGQNKYAELELRSARKLGEFLKTNVRPGRPGKRYSRSTNSLPKGVSRNLSSDCQCLASVNQQDFEQFITKSKEKRVLITRKGALRVFGKHGHADHQDSATHNPRRKKAEVTVEPAASQEENPNGVILPAPDVRPAEEPQAKPEETDELTEPHADMATEDHQAVWKVIADAMDVSFAVEVEPSLVGAPEGMPFDVLLKHKLVGNVVVWALERVQECLLLLNERRHKCQLKQAIAVFHATTGEPWFHLLDQHGWTCCFVRGISAKPLIVAYQGEQHRAIGLALERLGTVMRGIEAEPV